MRDDRVLIASAEPLGASILIFSRNARRSSGSQRLVCDARWDADAVRDGSYAAEHLGTDHIFTAARSTLDQGGVRGERSVAMKRAARG